MTCDVLCDVKGKGRERERERERERGIFGVVDIGGYEMMNIIVCAVQKPYY